MNVSNISPLAILTCAKFDAFKLDLELVDGRLLHSLGL